MQSKDVTENPRREVGDRKKGKHIGGEAKDGLKHLEIKELTKLVEELFDDIPRTSYPKTQTGIRLVAYSNVDQVVLHKLSKEVT